MTTATKRIEATATTRKLVAAILENEQESERILAQIERLHRRDRRNAKRGWKLRAMLAKHLRSLGMTPACGDPSLLVDGLADELPRVVGLEYDTLETENDSTRLYIKPSINPTH